MLDPDPHTGTAVVLCEMSFLEEHFISMTVWMVYTLFYSSQEIHFFLTFVECMYYVLTKIIRVAILDIFHLSDGYSLTHGPFK
jgi:hypothetical protein